MTTMARTQEQTQEQTRWLTDDEQLVWRAFVPMLQQLPAALDRQLQVDAGIPHTYYMILAMLSESPGQALRMSELADLTTTSQSRLSHAVARLEEQGWVERRPCPTDKRGQLALLTPAGFRRLAELAPGHVAEVRRIVFDGLTPAQLDALREIASTITGRIAGIEPG